ncbi:MAG: class I SAM-dependent methyltransferase [Phycisphaeraceae bacterium]|nr:class I SAM-dependent methyltransferase [Phycisphaeraceae bacterium]
MTATADQQIDDLINRHEASWRLGYGVFPAVLNKLGLKRGAEIGVAFGGHSEAILQNTGVEKLYAIDSYKHRPEYDDPMNLPQPVFDRLFERTGERLSKFGEKVAQIRLDSVEAAAQINEPLDFVYIDGDHSYAGIRADLEAWFPLVREGGIIAGHDYGQPAFPGVKAAADQFFKRFGLTVRHEGKGVWWAKRPTTSTTIIIRVDQSKFCDATLYSRLKAAGMTEQDHIILAHDEQHTCDAVARALTDHPHVLVQRAADLRGPWHAAISVIDQVTTPTVLPIGLDATLAKGSIRVLRNRLCHSGAQAAAYTTGQRTNGFALAAFLSTACPPTKHAMMMTTACNQARAAMPEALSAGSDQLIPWLVSADSLARGGRFALEPGVDQNEPCEWTQADCRLAAEALANYAERIDGTDLLRLKWPAAANNWLNQLDRKPVRTRANVLPVDVPPTHTTPRMLDRVLHKFRRMTSKAA